MPSRRSTPRFEARLEGSYALLAVPGEPFSTFTTNISERGCTIVTAERAEPVGARLRLELRTPSGERVRLVAAVVWSRAPTRTSTGGVILPGHSGLAFSTGEAVPGAY